MILLELEEDYGLWIMNCVCVKQLINRMREMKRQNYVESKWCLGWKVECTCIIRETTNGWKKKRTGESTNKA